MPTQVSSDNKKSVISEFKKAIRALGIYHGYAKGDIFISKGHAYIGEVAARLSGGFMSGFTYPYATGIDLMNLALDIATDCFKENLTPMWEKCSIERSIICHQSGIITKIKGIEKIKQEISVKDVFLHYSLGQIVSPPKNNVEKGGSIILVGETYQQVKASADRVMKEIEIIFQ